MIESRTVDWRAIGIGFAAGLILQVAMALASRACAQEGTTATLARVNEAEATWRRAAVVVPGPGWGPPVRQAIPEAPRPRQTAVQKVIDEAEGCAVAWHSRRKGRKTKIVCW